jgi:hypothetical protein
LAWWSCKEGINRALFVLLGVNGKTGEIYHMGGDSAGSAVLGKWTVISQGLAVLGVLYTTVNGQEGGLVIFFKIKHKDTLIVTPKVPNAINSILIRKKVTDKDVKKSKKSAW